MSRNRRKRKQKNQHNQNNQKLSQKQKHLQNGFAQLPLISSLSLDSPPPPKSPVPPAPSKSPVPNHTAQVLSKTATPAVVKGLRNLGNSCYFNSILQVLSHTPGLLSQLIPTDPEDDVTISLISVLKAMKSPNGPQDVNPCRLLDGLGRFQRRFSGRSQQDSHELLRTLLDLVKTGQLKAYKNHHHNSSAGDDDKNKMAHVTTIDSLFGGLMLSSVKCEGCESVSQLLEPFFDLSLPIRHFINSSNGYNNSHQNHKHKNRKNSWNDDRPAAVRTPSPSPSIKRIKIKVDDEKTAKLNWSLSTVSELDMSDDHKLSVESCLSVFTASESLRGSNQVYCETCSKNTKSTHDGFKVKCNSAKQMLIAYPPPILTLHLKRFQVDKWGYLQKINNQISFPLELDLSPWVSKIWTQMDDNSDAGLNYSLYGVVNHSGTLKSGHYTSMIKISNKSEDDIKKYVRLKPFVSSVESFLSSVRDWSQSDDGSPSSSHNMNGSIDSFEKWYHISDTQVRPVTKEAVMRSQAYILFYERI